MSETVTTAITRMTAELERTQRAPSDDLGFGRDLSCTTSIRPDLAEVAPDSPVGVGEAAIRRLITPRGGLPDDRDYGLDLRSYANRGVSVNELRDLEGMIRSEVMKDDRIANATVVVTAPTMNALDVSILIEPEDGTRTPFSLVLGLSDGDVVKEVIG